MDSKYPLVSIVTVNYSGRHFLRNCFDSLFGLDYPKDKFEVIMVDNGSQDGSLEFTQEFYPQIKILRNDVNNYCRANNLGIKHSKRKYIAFLNNDTRVEPDWLSELIKVIDNDETIGVVGSKILFMDGRINSAGHQELPDFYWQDKGANEKNSGQYDMLTDAESLCGCAVLYRKNIFDRVGDFDEDFNMYLEDVDMAIRIKKNGYRLVYAPKSVVYHVHQGSARGELPLFYSERNRLLLIAKYYPDRLNSALLGKGYFTVQKNVNAHTALYSALTEVILKLLKHNVPEISRKTLDELFVEAGKISDYNTKLLKNKIDELSETIMANQSFLKDKDEQISNLNGLIGKRDGIIKARDAQISSLSLEIEKSIAAIKAKDECLFNLDLAIKAKDVRLNTELAKRDKIITDIYNSTVFRFFVRPLWAALWKVKQFKRKISRKFVNPPSDSENIKSRENGNSFKNYAENKPDTCRMKTVAKSNYKARLICFYLPQFHPIPENDAWWGKGFTEWVNVAKAQPLFRGHYQPNMPADLGFYDLRLPEIRIAQAEMAKEYGIEGFCYWHYWFNGKRLLEKPFNEVLKSGEPNFPFCLGWANESWTGIWHGASDKMLIEQVYPGREDEEAHFYSLLEAFTDKRYITIEGKPIFYVYQPQKIPEVRKFVEHWQKLAIKSGLKGIYFIGEGHTPQWNSKQDGFDASVPHSPGLVFHKLLTGGNKCRHFMKKIKYGYFYRYIRKPKIFYYEDYIKNAIHELNNDFLQYPSILPNWDNTPRCGFNGFALIGSTPELFRAHLKKAVEQVSDRPYDKRVIFVKSWNEWAEGNHLEPNLKFGRGYLEVCREEAGFKEDPL